MNESNTTTTNENRDSRPPRSEDGGHGGHGGFKKKFVFKKKECYFTKNKITQIDFKDADLLKRFVGKNGRILPRRFTGTSALFQRKLAKAIKQARAIALLPYTGEVDFRPRGEGRSFEKRPGGYNRYETPAPVSAPATTPVPATPAPATTEAKPSTETSTAEGAQ